MRKSLFHRHLPSPRHNKYVMRCRNLTHFFGQSDISLNWYPNVIQLAKCSLFPIKGH